MNLTEMQKAIFEAEQIGVTFSAAEVGPQTWKALIAMVPKAWLGQPPKVFDRVQFMGIHIRPADVPEGKLWPLDAFSSIHKGEE